MSKDAINQYDATAANNTDVGGISIDEGMLPSNVNNALREIMSHLKDVDAGTSSLTSPVISGDLTVDTSTLKVDSSNNRVGVNTTSPIGDGIHVKVPDGGTGLILSGTTTSTGTEAKLTSVNEAGDAWHNLNIGANNTIFRAAGTEKARITTDGLTFNGDTAAVNALNDYQRGTWTAGFKGTVTNPTIASVTNSTGVYTKIGDLVFIQYYSGGINISHAGTGSAYIDGLPFSPSDSPGVANQYSVLTFTHTNAFASQIQNGYTARSFAGVFPVIEGSINLTTWATGSAKYVMFSGVYRTDA